MSIPGTTRQVEKSNRRPAHLFFGQSAPPPIRDQYQCPAATVTATVTRQGVGRRRRRCPQYAASASLVPASAPLPPSRPAARRHGVSSGRLNRTSKPGDRGLIVSRYSDRIARAVDRDREHDGPRLRVDRDGPRLPAEYRNLKWQLEVDGPDI